jgi:hypothetical protein
MPASRILDGRLPEQHPQRAHMFLRPTTASKTEPKRDIKGEAP